MIEAQQLSYRYPGQSEDTLRELSFAIHRGEIFGFLGPSGAGKSTTQKLLIGLLHGYRGKLTIMDRESHQWHHELYQRIGVGFELPNHFSKLSGLENLQLFATFFGLNAGAARHRARELLTLVDLQDAATQRVAEYSKGMKMRLNFARALLNDPDLLFLDEPTAGLDPVNARLIKGIILQQKQQGKTVFLTTHNMLDADQLCDQVGFIVQGELRLVGTPEKLKLEHGRKTVKITCHNEQGDLETLELPLKGLAQEQNFLRLLSTDSIESIHSQEATLEDVFISTTGTRLS